MTTVFLDTSIIIDEHFLRSANAHAFFKACAFLGIEIVVPSIVVDETKGNYPKWSKEKLSALQKARRELAKIADVGEPEVALDDLVKRYDEWLDKFLDQHDVSVPPYPEVSPKELVEKSYEGRKPFKESGEGHKDYLLWRTIVLHCEGQGAQPPTFFLTKNTKDFCADGPDEAKILHPDLANGIADLAKRPVVYLSLKKLFDEKLAPQLEGVELADVNDLTKQDIESRAAEILEAGLLDYSATGFDGVPFTDDLVIASVQDTSVDGIQLKKVEGELVIEVSGTVDIEIDGFIEKSAYYQMEDGDGPDVHIVDGDWNDWVMQASVTITTPFSVTLIYDVSSKTFSSSSIELPEERENDWF